MSDTVSRTMSVVQPNLPEGLAGKNIQLPPCRHFSVLGTDHYFSRGGGGRGYEKFPDASNFFLQLLPFKQFFFLWQACKLFILVI